MKTTSRREFLAKSGSGLFAFTALSGLSILRGLWSTEASAADAALPACSDANPVAAAIGYKADVKQADPMRQKPAAKNQFCGNCALFTKIGDGKIGKCTMMADCTVSAQGWCKSYSKKM